jgi:hypothetical protein
MFGLKFREVKKAVEATQTVVQPGMTLEQVRTGMLQLLSEESINHHRLGQLYNYAVDNELAEGAGYSGGAPDYFSKNLPEVSVAALRMYGAVAEVFSEEVCAEYGITCLYLLRTYEEAADIKVDHEKPGPTVIEVPDEKGAVRAKAFSECSVEELRKAIQRKRKPSSSKPLPAKEVELTDQVRKEVTSRFAKGTPVRVQIRNHKGEALLDFKGIPRSKLATLVLALVAQPWVRQELAGKLPPME